MLKIYCSSNQSGVLIARPIAHGQQVTINVLTSEDLIDVAPPLATSQEVQVFSLLGAGTIDVPSFASATNSCSTRGLTRTYSNGYGSAVGLQAQDGLNFQGSTKDFNRSVLVGMIQVLVFLDAGHPWSPLRQVQPPHRNHKLATQASQGTSIASILMPVTGIMLSVQRVPPGSGGSSPQTSGLRVAQGIQWTGGELNARKFFLTSFPRTRLFLQRSISICQCNVHSVSSSPVSCCTTGARWLTMSKTPGC